jgi:Rieske Fe-S protein
VSAVPVGALVVVAGIFLMGRDAKGIYAMSMQCTHKGCALAFSGMQLDCPCHHSRFDSNGNVLLGPATTPLPHFAVSVDAAGNMSVDRYTVVSGSARTAV